MPAQAAPGPAGACRNELEMTIATPDPVTPASMAQQAGCHLRHRLLPTRRLLRERRSAVSVEIAIVGLPFFLMMLGTMEVAYDMFVQSALNSAVVLTARKIASGQIQMVDGTAGGQSFVSTYFCPNVQGLLQCGHIYVNIQKVTSADFYTYVPSAYLNGSGPSATLNYANWSVCTGGQSTPMIMQAVYAGPTFVGGLARAFVATYNGSYIHPTYATDAWVNTSGYTQTISC